VYGERRWSGTEATSGTLTVTPASSGSYSYTLTCTGNGAVPLPSRLSRRRWLRSPSLRILGGAMTCPCSWVGIIGAAAPAGGAAHCSRAICRRARPGGVPRIFACSSRQAACHAQTRRPRAGRCRASWWIRSTRGFVSAACTRMSAGNIDRSLAGLGYPGVGQIRRHRSPAAPCMWLRIGAARGRRVRLHPSQRKCRDAEWNRCLGCERHALLQDTTDVIRGYGNIFSLTFRPRAENRTESHARSAYRWFFLDTKSRAGAGFRVDNTHEGGG